MNAIEAVCEACAEVLGHDVIFGEIPGYIADLKRERDLLELRLKVQCEACENAERELATAKAQLSEAMKRCADYHPQDEALLDAPCLFCGYNGSGYWQSGTHAAHCIWHKIGGFEERMDAIRAYAESVRPVAVASTSTAGEQR